MTYAGKRGPGSGQAHKCGGDKSLNRIPMLDLQQQEIYKQTIQRPAPIRTHLACWSGEEQTNASLSTSSSSFHQKQLL